LRTLVVDRAENSDGKLSILKNSTPPGIAIMVGEPGDFDEIQLIREEYMISRNLKILSIHFIVIVFGLFILTSCGWNNLPEGEFLASYESPSQNHTVNIYLSGGNATTDFAIRGELVDNGNKDKKNIYWAYHEQDAEVEWISDVIVSINGKQLDLSKNQTYDYRDEI